MTVIDSGSVFSKDFLYHESRKCSGDTYPESYITKYTSIRRLTGETRVYSAREIRRVFGAQPTTVIPSSAMADKPSDLASGNALWMATVLVIASRVAK